MVVWPSTAIIKPSLAVGMAKHVPPGLLAFIPLNEMTGSPRIYYPGGTILGTLSGAKWAPRDEAGILIGTANTSGNKIDFGTPSILQNLGQSATGFTCVIRAFIAAGGGGLLARTDGNTVNAGWAFYANTTPLVSLAIERSTTNMYTHCAGPSIGTWATIGCGWNGNLTGSGEVVKFAINGIKKAPTYTANGSGTVGSDATQHLYVGFTNGGWANDAVTNASLAGWVSWAAIWDHQLSDGELAQVTAPGFSMFEPITPYGFRGIGVPASALLAALFGSSSATAGLTGLGALADVILGSSSVSASFLAAIAALINGTSTVASLLRGTGEFLAAITGTGSVQCSLTAEGLIQCEIDGVGSVIVHTGEIVALAAVIAGSATVSSFVARLLNLEVISAIQRTNELIQSLTIAPPNDVILSVIQTGMAAIAAAAPEVISEVTPIGISTLKTILLMKTLVAVDRCLALSPGPLPPYGSIQSLGSQRLALYAIYQQVLELNQAGLAENQGPASN